MTLRAKTVPVRRLTDAERLRMWQIFSNYYDCVDPEQFRHDLDTKDRVILLIDGEIQGFSTMKEVSVLVDGVQHRGMFSGDTVLERPYWGTKVLGRAFLRHLAIRTVLNPLTPYWWILITKGYKTYLLMANNFPEHYPNAGVPTPPPIQRTMQAFGRELFGNAYHAEQNWVRYPESRGQLKDGVAEISATLRTDQPRVAHFEDLNPDWRAGTELLCLARMRVTLPFRYALKAWRGTPGTGPL